MSVESMSRGGHENQQQVFSETSTLFYACLSYGDEEVDEWDVHLGHNLKSNNKLSGADLSCRWKV